MPLQVPDVNTILAILGFGALFFGFSALFAILLWPRK